MDARAMTVPIGGGITAARGFRTAGVAAGIKASGLDMALVASDEPASAAGLFTTSRAAAPPVTLSRRHLDRSGGRASAVIVNSGCANACTGAAGMAAAETMAAETARLVSCPVDHVLVASTGVIGVTLDVEVVTAGITTLAGCLSRDRHADAAQAIMTTDPWPKEHAVRVDTPAGSFHVGGMAKGSGMIEPMLATMLAFLTTDASVEPRVLRRALAEAVDDTFNSITVDGECSTNDAVIVLASGASGIHIDDSLYGSLADGLRAVCLELALGIVRGGEGATKLVRVEVTGATSPSEARVAARTIANSLLVKTAVHGRDPNWGRLVAVAGRAGVSFDLERARIAIGDVELFRHGQPFDERAPAAADHLLGDRVGLSVDLGTGGSGTATIWTCDLSAEYVRINADYRT